MKRTEAIKKAATAVEAAEKALNNGPSIAEGDNNHTKAKAWMEVAHSWVTIATLAKS